MSTVRVEETITVPGREATGTIMAPDNSRPPMGAADDTVTAAAAAGEYRLPDGPRSPALLNGILFLLTRQRIMHRFKRRYGDAYTVRFPAFGTAVVVSRPELVKEVYTAKPSVLHGGKNPLGEVLGAGSLFSMDEDRHLAERRALLPPFHGDRMRSYDGLIEEEALLAMRAWRDGEEFATLKTFNRITLRVILRAVFGAEGAQLADFEELLPRMAALGQRLVTAPFLRRDYGRFSPGRRYAAMRRRYDEIAEALIDRHLADPALGERIDILALMLSPLRDAGEGIDRQALADELLTLLLAGHETTASSLAWTVERLRRHPELLRRLEDEAAGESSTLRAATILEVLRTRPVIAATGRVVMQPFELGPWRLPPGTRVITEGSMMHRDERFHDDALTFDPERYVGSKPDTYAWIPFGGGVRRCIGAAFAQLEMDVVIRTMLRHFELVPTDTRDERESFRGVAFAPARGGVAVVRRRREPLGTSATQPATETGCPVGHDAYVRDAAATGCPVDHAARAAA
jgi:cytochrome P450 family 138